MFLPQWEWSLHLWSGRPVDAWVVSLRLTPTSRACPGEKAASWMRVCWSGEITWTSLPPCQVGRKTSTGLDRDSGIKPWASRDGLRAADWAAEKITSLTHCGGWFWSLYSPAEVRHAGQRWGGHCGEGCRANISSNRWIPCPACGGQAHLISTTHAQNGPHGTK